MIRLSTVFFMFFLETYELMEIPVSSSLWELNRAYQSCYFKLLYWTLKLRFDNNIPLTYPEVAVRDDIIQKWLKHFCRSSFLQLLFTQVKYKFFLLFCFVLRIGSLVIFSSEFTLKLHGIHVLPTRKTFPLTQDNATRKKPECLQRDSSSRLQCSVMHPLWFIKLFAHHCQKYVKKEGAPYSYNAKLIQN